MTFSLTTMQQLVPAWIGLYLVFTGLGLLMRRGLGVPPTSARQVFDAFWVGFGLTVAALQIWHLLLPVTARPFALIGLAGLAGLLLERRLLWRLLRAAPRHWPLLPILLLLALVIGSHAINSPMHYDDGLYHIQDMRWAQAHAIVPGLGNLHGRFAFNNALSLPWAMIDSLPRVPPVQHVGGSLLGLALLMPLLWSGWQVIRTQSTRLTLSLDLLLLGPVLFIGFISLGFSSLKNDFTLFLLAIVVARHLLQLFESPPVSARQRRYAAFELALLVGVAVSIKLSFAVQGLLTLMLALAVLVRWPDRLDLRRSLGVVAVMAGVSLAVVVPWLARGVILSGYPLYPEPSLSVAVEWRVPYESAARERDWVRSWARQPGPPPEQVLANWDWLSSWLRTQRIAFMRVVVPLALAGLALAVTGVYALRFRAWNVFRTPMWWWLLPLGGALVFWFITAPDPRFGWHLFWLLGAGVTSIVLRAIASPQRQFQAVVYIALLLIANTLLRLHWGASVHEQDLRPIPVAEVEVFVTQYGLEVYVPVTGDQCWDAPLPCTPFRRALLRLRQPDDVAHGFVIGGP